MTSKTEKFYEMELSEDGKTWQFSRHFRTLRVAKATARRRYHTHTLVRINAIILTPGAGIERKHYETLGYERLAS
jgi:hypothetical protein